MRTATTAPFPDDEFFRRLPAKPAILIFLASLAELPPGQANPLIAFLDFWNQLSGEDKAIHAITVRPDLSDREIAAIAGVSLRTLYRYAAFQDVKRRLAAMAEAEFLERNGGDFPAA